jgi:hypothetical protein
MENPAVWVRSVVFTMFLGASCPDLAVAQPEDGRPGRGGSHSARELMRDIDQSAPHREILRLLFHEPIRSEINMTDEQWEAFKSQMRNSFESTRELWGKERRHEITREELKAELLAAIKELDQQARELLDDGQFDRLLGIYVQHRGIAAAENGEVAKRIGLTGEELDNVRRSQGQFKRELIEMNQPRIDHILKMRNEETPRNLGRLFAEIDDAVNDRLAMELSDEQRDKLETLKGEPFSDFPPLFMGRRPGGPPVGPGSGHGGRGRGEGRGDGRGSHNDR